MRVNAFLVFLLQVSDKGMSTRKRGKIVQGEFVPVGEEGEYMRELLNRDAGRTVS